MANPHGYQTLASMIAGGYAVDAYCQAQGCQRPHLELDIYDLALAFGARIKNPLPLRWPIRCSTCGSRDISFRVTPEHLPIETARKSQARNFRRSRPDLERAALEILFPRKWS